MKFEVLNVECRMGSSASRWGGMVCSLFNYDFDYLNMSHISITRYLDGRVSSVLQLVCTFKVVRLARLREQPKLNCRCDLLRHFLGRTCT
jgi:hypothetical protein